MAVEGQKPGAVSVAELTPNGPMLVRRRGQELGTVYRLDKSRRLGIGRAETNFIVIHDDGCSRNHAEVYWNPLGWMIEDLGSLNGTRINGKRVEGPTALSPQDSITMGATEFVFLDSLTSLNLLKPPPSRGDRFSVKHRQNQTQQLHIYPREGRRSSRDWQTLYGLALEMGQARDAAELATMVLEALTQASPIDTGAVLRFYEEREYVLLASQVPSGSRYSPPADDILALCFAERDALLVEETLETNGSSNKLSRRTMIVAPIVVDEEVYALLHLYSSSPFNVATSEDLDLAVAVTQQLGPALVALERQTLLTSENEQLRESLRVESELIGQSKGIRDVLQEVALVAPTNATVMICGESGVGKELVARAIHFSSKRRGGPFVCLNCAALPETLLESELFGHEKGAFTGATEQKKGKFEVAHKGSIFLDEIGEMSLAVQAKLLRVLDGQAFERVGGDKPIKAQVRVVAATNRDLEKGVAEGKFRSDLYYRLRVVELRIPPLRARVDDIPLLANHFLKRFAGEMGRKVRGFTSEAMAKLTAYDWPGNVRELKNCIERAVVLSRGAVIGAEEISISGPKPAPAIGFPPVQMASPVHAPVSLEQIEAEHIAATLRYTGWNKSQTAAILGIERSTLDRKIKRYNIQEPG